MQFRKALEPIVQIGCTVVHVTGYEFSCYISQLIVHYTHCFVFRIVMEDFSHTGQRLLSVVRIKFNNRSCNPFADVCRIVWKIQTHPAFSSLRDNISMLIPPISCCIIHSVQERRPAYRLEILSNIFHYSHMVPIFSPFAITLDHDL